jgi:hypothetical protein
MRSELLRKRIMATNRELFGSDWFTGSDDWRSQVLETLQTRYGQDITNVSQLGWVKDKKIVSCLLSLGVDNPSQSEEVKFQKMLTLFHNYQVLNPTQSKEIYQTIYDTNIKKYGFKMRLQNPKEWAKHRKAMFSTKIYPIAGRILHLQGYEPDCIDWFQLEGFKENWFRECLESFFLQRVLCISP